MLILPGMYRGVLQLTTLLATYRRTPTLKGLMMEVFGEEYDLSTCTPEEVKQVEAWYEANKEAEVTVDSDMPSGLYHTERVRAKSFIQTDDLNIAIALESLQGNTKFSPDLKGRTEYIALYLKVHPLGGNMRVEDASAELGINKVTAYRWLTKLAKDNPAVYDLHKWPTKSQLDVYRLIHPELGGLTYREAAKALNSTYQHVVQMMHRMRKTHPQAFSFERIRKPSVVSFDKYSHDEEVVEKF